MVELLGPIPKYVAFSGKLSKKFFDSNGKLRRIKGLQYWPLKKVMMERYWFMESEAEAFSDFMLPMLEWDQEKWATAQEVLMKSKWLSMPKNEEFKMNEK